MTHKVHELQWGPLKEQNSVSNPRLLRRCFGTAAIVWPWAPPWDDTNTNAPDVRNDHTPGNLRNNTSAGQESAHDRPDHKVAPVAPQLYKHSDHKGARWHTRGAT